MSDLHLFDIFAAEYGLADPPPRRSSLRQDVDRRPASRQTVRANSVPTATRLPRRRLYTLGMR